MAARKKIGRPRKAAEIRKDAYLRVRLTDAHDAEIKAAAEATGISISAWVTMTLHDAAVRKLRQVRAEAAEDPHVEPATSAAGKRK